MRDYSASSVLHKFKRQPLNFSDSTDCFYLNVRSAATNFAFSFSAPRYLSVGKCPWHLWETSNVYVVQNTGTWGYDSSYCKYICFATRTVLNLTLNLKYLNQIAKLWPISYFILANQWITTTKSQKWLAAVWTIMAQTLSVFFNLSPCLNTSRA